MSPEQALGQPVDARSDLFSLGTIAYAMLTGHSPFAGPSVPAILARVAHRDAPPPSERVPGLPRDVDDVLARALAKSREDRYPSGRMMAEDIEDVLGDRPPRHRAGWTPTPTGERTIASSGPAVDGAVALDLAEDARPAPPPRARWRSRLERVALVAVAATAAVHFSRHPEDATYWLGVGREAHRRLTVLTTPFRMEPRPAPATPSPEPAMTATPDVAALPSPGPGPDAPIEPSPEPSPEPPVEPSAEPTPVATPPTPDVPGPSAPAAPVPEPAPTPPAQPAATEASARAATPSPSPSPRPSKSKPVRPPARKPSPAAWLSIGFEHHLASGTLEVWVDGKSMVKEALDSRVTRKLLMLELRKGSVQETLTLAPGRHEVRVRLRSGEDRRTARTTAIFKAEATRRLEVTASRLGGGLTLEWK
jgi:serine/threonine-protein kinase